MALIAALAILAIGSTSTMVMAHRGHHSDSGSSIAEEVTHNQTVGLHRQSEMTAYVTIAFRVR